MEKTQLFIQVLKKFVGKDVVIQVEDDQKEVVKWGSGNILDLDEDRDHPEYSDVIIDLDEDCNPVGSSFHLTARFQVGMINMVEKVTPVDWSELEYLIITL